MLFKANYDQDLRMGFEKRRRGKYEAAGKFVERMRKIQKKAKMVLGKAQEEMKKFADRKQGEEEEYKGLEMADERKKIRKVDQMFCGTIQS